MKVRGTSKEILVQVIDKEVECGGWWVKMGGVLTTLPQTLSTPFSFFHFTRRNQH